VLDALEMGIWAGRELDGLIHHSDRAGNTWRSVTPRGSGEAGAVNSVRFKGDSYDNALAETIIGLHKFELIRRRGPRRGIDDVEYATLEWVDWSTTGGSSSRFRFGQFRISIQDGFCLCPY
jgi:putative transposase